MVPLSEELLEFRRRAGVQTLDSATSYVVINTATSCIVRTLLISRDDTDIEVRLENHYILSISDETIATDPVSWMDSKVEIQVSRA
jgi:hypothetical protein